MALQSRMDLTKVLTLYYIYSYHNFDSPSYMYFYIAGQTKQLSTVTELYSINYLNEVVNFL